MSDKQADDQIPEFAHLDTATRRRELAAVGASARQKLGELKKRLKLPSLIDIETKVEPLANLLGCPTRYLVLGLSVGPDQRLRKTIFDQWSEGSSCYTSSCTFDFQFTGYGGYCLSFEKDTGNTNLFNNFFRDIAAYQVNFHRTFVFTIETYENLNASQVHRLLLDGDGRTTSPNPAYLENLQRLVMAAKQQGIVVQVCLFMHQSVVGAPDRAAPPLPVKLTLTGSPHARYKTFYNTASPYLPMQGKLIDGVVTKLRPHWNVVYEIGNELRVPNPPSPDPSYGEPHLKAWIDWAAARVRANDPSHLITTSTGFDNDGPINQLSRIQFCSFHQGQWKDKMNQACDRANGFGGKHVVFDDDGSARPLAQVKVWAKDALNTSSGCRCSFNHKGNAPIGAYDPQWMNKIPDGGTYKAIDALNAIRDARVTSSSPCAHG